MQIQRTENVSCEGLTSKYGYFLVNIRAMDISSLVRDASLV